MNATLSPAASRARYQYNRKYVDAYWERRAAKMQAIEGDEVALKSELAKLKRIAIDVASRISEITLKLENI